MKKNILLFVIGFLFFSTVFAQSPVDSAIPSNEQIRQILVERLGEYKDRVGIVVGVIEPSGRRIIAFGSMDKNDKRPLDGNSVFEIGSITKVFTSLLLADMVQHKEVSLNDPAAKYLPPGVKMPERNGHFITLINLSEHRSGLPPMPTNFTPSNAQNPYADYTVKQLYDFLSGYTLTRDIDAEFQYSNLGVGLLGHVLSRAAGMDYDELIQSRILQPLGMKNTAIALSAAMKANLAIGHNTTFTATSNWDLTPAFAGAGALRSTANDMLSFLAAQLGYTHTGLDDAIALTRSPKTPASNGMEIGLGWLIKPKKGSEVIWHSGGTGGYRTFAGYDLKAKTGVVVLFNGFTPAGVDDLGLHLLDSESPLLPPNSLLVQPGKLHKEITLDAGILDHYTGQYQFASGVVLTITRKNNQLFAQLPGQGISEIYPETQTDFFSRVGTVYDVQVMFKTDSQGRANALVLRQMGRDQIAERTNSNAEPVQEWFGHRVNPVDPAILKNYAGKYQLASGAVLTITLDGNRLQAQLTGQPSIEIYPESEKEFFLKIVDAQLTFESDGKGPASAVTLHQNGLNIRAARITE